MKKLFLLTTLILSTTHILSQNLSTSEDSLLYQKAIELCNESLIIDTHIDLPDWLYDEWFDVSNQVPYGEFDYSRAIKGGLNVAFMSIYTSPRLEGSPESKIRADSMITLVEKIGKDWHDKFAVVKSVEDILNEKNKEKILLAIGMENGSPISNNLENLIHFYNRGVRYITLAHYKYNHISDSANDPERKWNGLSPFGIEVVKEMNKLGIIVDVSHISDSAFYDIMRLTKAPVIASHSCCRFFTPGYERNMSDEMLIELAKNGGVIQIAFAGFFLTEEINKQEVDGDLHFSQFISENHLDPNSPEAYKFKKEYWEKHPMMKAKVEDVINHIEHVIKLVGIDHVGIGSDFNGIGSEVPIGLEDVSKLPNLVFHLLKRGYSDKDISKILGANTIRVWKEVEKVSNQLSEK